MPFDSSHRCPIGTCPTRVSGSRLMCTTHWALVPPGLQKAVYDTWANGRGMGSAGHRRAITAATDAVNSQLEASHQQAT